ncbi:cardiolipin synthase [Paenibacillus sp. CGMCC 1.16610]|uniref:Cardiolipin synthase n=1 Tax=Paenibacillus anseongense TaxID=2682845 RepID=A0ABW9UD62_9BACL|nr:phospholipase D-like domain-containing protein [Paenibacillus sp. CGMCC 1.16610]MBA2937266.1 cardiolipin synthase [Paenibacillus sp. CGMCC 1.16610]MVQ36325.1 cardiolipin synthase [Paenibacillus anseongense]
MRKVLFTPLLLFLLIGWVYLDIEKGVKEADAAKQSSFHYADFQMYNAGQNLYDSLFSDIQKAKEYIYIHFFIIRNDEISNKFLTLLEDKAKLGVDVKLSTDRMGSFLFKKSMRERLRKAGVQFTFSGKPTFPHFFYTLQNRNHRRITVIDGTTAYIGGFNMGKEHLDQDKRVGHWEDYHFRISGDGAQDMERQFLLDWKNNTGDSFPVHSSSPINGNTGYDYLFTDGKGLAERYQDWIMKASHSIVIASPYFIPGKKMVDELIEARKRGVAIKILVPLNSNFPMIKQAAYPYLRELLKNGAEIYLYQNGFFHGKVLSIDGKYVMTGTPNFDTRTFYLNKESVCSIYGGPIIAEIQKKLQDEFRMSKRISDTYFDDLNIWERFLERTISIVSFYL